MTDHVARATVQIDAGPQSVWDALTDPEQIATWMLGSRVTTDWAVGSDIRWKGEMNGEEYEDKGQVLVYDEPTRLSMTHYSPLMGEPDEPESYHTVTYEITPDGEGSVVELSQDGNDSAEQAEQFGDNWQSMLDGLKRAVESR